MSTTRDRGRSDSPTCSKCGARPRRENFSWCDECNRAHVKAWRAERAKDPEWRERENTRRREYWATLRLEALNAYGGVCECCGETETVFLDLDHIDGGGTAHRRKTGSRWHAALRRAGWPAGYRVLCRNCNWAEYRGGCPHHRKDESGC